MNESGIANKRVRPPACRRLVGLAAALMLASVTRTPARADSPLSSVGVLGTSPFVCQGDPVPPVNDRHVDPLAQYGILATQSEMSITVSPLNNMIVLVSANTTNFVSGEGATVRYGVGNFTSTDGGVTWSGSNTRPQEVPFQIVGDPAVAIDRDGNYYINAIYFNTAVNCRFQILLRRLANASTWDSYLLPELTDSCLPGFDKNHMAVDNSLTSPFQGRIYIAWSRFISDFISPISVDSRGDHGSTSLGAYPDISSGFAEADRTHQGVNLQVAADGTLYACWAVRECCTTGIELGIGFNVGHPSAIGNSLDWEQARYVTNPAGNRLDIEGIRALTYYDAVQLPIRTNSFPSMGIDQQTGAIYITWINKGVPGVNGGDPDAYVIRSLDHGQHWSTPVRVNNDGAGNIQFHCWLTVDPLVANSVYVTFCDNRANPGTNTYQYYVAHSTDGGQTWDNTVVSDHPFCVGPIPGFTNYYFGDYDGVAARTGRVYPSWNSNAAEEGNSQGWASPFIHPQLAVASTTLEPVEHADYQATDAITVGPVFEAKSGSFSTFRATNEVRVTPTSGTLTGDVRLAGEVNLVLGGVQGSPPSSAAIARKEGQGGDPEPRSLTLALGKNSPNPFSPRTTIEYVLPEPGRVELLICDVAGRKVAELANGPEPAGMHRVTWEAVNQPAGIYYSVLRSGNQVRVAKMMLLK